MKTTTNEASTTKYYVATRRRGESTWQRSSMTGVIFSEGEALDAARARKAESTGCGEFEVGIEYRTASGKAMFRAV